MPVSRMMVLLFSLLSLAGCATYGQVSSLELENQKKIFREGRETLLSQKQHTVSIAPPSETVQSGHRASFIIAVRNGAEHDIVFSTPDIVAFLPNAVAGTGDEMLKVYSYDELVEEERKRQAWAAVGAALQGAADSMNAANAGYSHTYGSYSGSAYSRYGTSAHGYGTYSGTTYNYAAAQAAGDAARAKSEARFAQIEVEGRAALEGLSTAILKKQTIFPGDWHGGIVKVQMPPVEDAPVELLVTVTVGGEQHSFKFLQTKVQK